MAQNDSKAFWRQHGITAGPVEDYLYSVLPPRDEVLAQMEAEAIKRNIPIVGPAVGRFLHQLALISGAKTVFELGSAIGYSTIWWARAVGEGGRVIYTDGDPKNAAEARGYFSGRVSPTGSRSRLATRWNCSPKRSSSSTSSSMMLTRWTILACFDSPCPSCAKVDCS